MESPTERDTSATINSLVSLKPSSVQRSQEDAVLSGHLMVPKYHVTTIGPKPENKCQRVWILSYKGRLVRMQQSCEGDVNSMSAGMPQ